MTNDEIEKDWSWGKLQHHHSDCPSEECDDDCDDCEGSGRVFWGSFYREDEGECDMCHGVQKISDFGDSWICLGCYVTVHQEDCGCDLWAEAERALR